jgi:hypothetical protein
VSALARVRCPTTDTTLLVDRSTAWLVRAPGVIYASWRCTCHATHHLQIALTNRDLVAFRFSGIPMVNVLRDPELLDARRSPCMPELGAADVWQLDDELYFQGHEALVGAMPEHFVLAVLAGRIRPPG